MHLLTLVKIAHLVGLIMGLGSVVFLDFTIIRQGIFRPVSKYTLHQVEVLSRAVTGGLVILWLTGALLIWMNLHDKPNYLDNPKLWAKIIIVVILSANGILIHAAILPLLRRRLGHRLFDGMSNRMIVMMTFVASVSLVSWITPFVLGKASELNFVTPMDEILSAYFCAVVFTWGVMLSMMSAVAGLADLAGPKQSRPAAGTLDREPMPRPDLFVQRLNRILERQDQRQDRMAAE